MMMMMSEDQKDSMILQDIHDTKLGSSDTLVQNLTDAVSRIDTAISELTGSPRIKYSQQPMEESFENEKDGEEFDACNLKYITTGTIPTGFSNACNAANDGTYCPSARGWNSEDADDCDDNDTISRGFGKNESLLEKLNATVQMYSRYLDERMTFPVMKTYGEVPQPVKKGQNYVINESAVNDLSQESDRLDAQLEDLNETLELRKHHALGDKYDPGIIKTLLNIGQVLFEKQEYAQAKSTLLDAFDRLSKCRKRSQEEKDLMLNKMATALIEICENLSKNGNENSASRAYGQALDCFHLAGLQDTDFYRHTAELLTGLGTNFDQDYDDVSV